MFSSVAGGQVTKPCVCSLEPAGSQVLTPVSCEGTPPVDSVPLIVILNSTAAPAPRMFPVWGKPFSGTALATSVIAGAADAAAGRPKAARQPSRARQVDALRISFHSSVDGQVRLDPGSSGTCAGPAISRSPAIRRRTVATSSDNIIHRSRYLQVVSARRGGVCKRTCALPPLKRCEPLPVSGTATQEQTPML